MTVKNLELESKSLSFRAAGQQKIWAMKIDNHKNESILVGFECPENVPNMTLLVYMQYGKPPKKSEYDLKLDISNDGIKNFQIGSARNFSLDLKQDTFSSRVNNSVNSHANKTRNLVERKQTLRNASNYKSCVDDKGHIDSGSIHDELIASDGVQPKSKSAPCRMFNDRSFICNNFNNFNYADRKNGVLWFSAVYTGPLPNKTFVSNPYTYSVKEYEGSMNFSVRTFIPGCRFWNTEKNEYDQSGLRVSCLVEILNASKICIEFVFHPKRSRACIYDTVNLIISHFCFKESESFFMWIVKIT